MPQLSRLTLCAARGGMQHAASISAAFSDCSSWITGNAEVDRNEGSRWITSALPTTRKSEIAALNVQGLIALAARVRWHQVVRTVVDHKLAIVLAAVLDSDHPDVGVVGQPVPKFRCFIQPRVALLLNHLRTVRNSLLHELHDIGLGLEIVTRGIVALAEVGP